MRPIIGLRVGGISLASSYVRHVAPKPYLTSHTCCSLAVTLPSTGASGAGGCTVLCFGSSMDAYYHSFPSLPLYSRDMARPPKSRARYPDIEKEYEVQDTLGSGEWRKGSALVEHWLGGCPCYRWVGSLCATLPFVIPTC